MTITRLPLALAATLALIAPAAHAGTAMGDWLTPKGGAKVHVASCGDKICGTITWLKNATDKATGKPQTDTKNPDPALRSRPVVGLQFLRGFHPDGDNRWSGGSIYDPGSGKTYDSKMTLGPDGLLKVAGCVAVFCVTQIWTPVH
jgi:uncharacterized protein (DUF2147 family)